VAGGHHGREPSRFPRIHQHEYHIVPKKYFFKDL
jgi:hypothetical protein